MQVLLSWSGERSKFVANALHWWLPKVLQPVRPWMSEEDIEAGARWIQNVSSALVASKVGLICVTPENLSSPWLHFEAGALSKTLDQTCVCPILFDLAAGQLVGPLTQFQASVLSRDGMGKVLSTINSQLADARIEPRNLDEILDVWWPHLESRLAAIHPSGESFVPRSVDDQLEELLLLTRENQRRENIRLEALRDRDGKLDHFLDLFQGFLVKANALEEQAKRAQILLSERMAARLPGERTSNDHIGPSPGSLFSEARSHSDSPQGPDVRSFRQIAKDLRDIHERDKLHLASMIEPPSDTADSK